jgi:hypothetical protein
MWSSVAPQGNFGWGLLPWMFGKTRCFSDSAGATPGRKAKGRGATKAAIGAGFVVLWG